jgi:hypothetical protein
MNPRSAAFWSGVDAREQARAKRLARNREIERADPQAHVELWDTVAGLAKILGRDRAVAIVCRDLASPNESEEP